MAYQAPLPPRAWLIAKVEPALEVAAADAVARGEDQVCQVQAGDGIGLLLAQLAEDVAVQLALASLIEDDVPLQGDAAANQRSLIRQPRFLEDAALLGEPEAELVV